MKDTSTTTPLPLRRRRLAFLAIAAVVAALSLLMGLFTAQRAQSAAGQVLVTNMQAGTGGTKLVNLWTLDPGDATCSNASGHSIKSVIEASGFSTSVSEYKVLEVHNREKATRQDMPQFLLFHKQIQTGQTTCPYVLSQATNRTYFAWGAGTSNRTSATSKMHLFMANDLSIFRDKANPKVGQKVNFAIPPIDTRNGYKVKWRFGSEKTIQPSNKTQVSHTFKKAGEHAVKVSIHGPGGFRFHDGVPITVGEKNPPKDDKPSDGGNTGGDRGGQGGGTNGNGVGGGTDRPSFNPPPPPVDLWDEEYPDDDDFFPEEEPLPPTPVEPETPTEPVEPTLPTVSGIAIASNGTYVPNDDTGSGSNSPVLTDLAAAPPAAEMPLLLDEEGLGVPGAVWFSLAAILLLGLGVAVELEKLRFGWLREAWLNLRYKLGV